MKICSCEINGFGKFHQRKFDFSDGINLISGENESGKSTLHTFVRAMLYGLKRKRGRASRTDDYTKYFPWDAEGGYGGTLLFESGGKRFLLKRDFQKGEASLVCLDDYEELSVENGDLEMLLGGYGEAVFSETLAVAQMTDPDGRAFTEFLKDRQSGYLNAEKPEGYGIGTASGRTLQQALQNLNDRRRGCRKHLEELEREKEEAALRREENVRAAETRVRNAEEALRREEIRAEGQRAEIRKERNADLPVSSPGTNRKDVPPGESSGKPSASGAFPRTGIAAFLLLITLVVMRQVFPETGPVFSGISITLTVGMIFALLVMIAAFAKYYRENQKGRPGKTETSPDPERGVSKEEETAGRLRELDWNVNRRRQELEEERAYLAEIRENTEGGSGQAEETDDTLARRISDAEREMDAVQLAIRTMKELSERSSGREGGRIAGRAAGILRQLTAGKYSALSLEKDRLSLFDGARYMPVERVSRGTREQVYFALRMAAAEMIYEKEDRMILLDETLVAYDDKRLAAALRWLAECGEQVLLFTCQSREERLMKREGISCQVIRL